MPPKIETGFRIGKLTVAAPTGARKNGYTIWNCVFDCGGTIELDTRTLQRGTVRDCGCETKVKPGQKDLTGQRFGRLVCLEPSNQRDKQGGTQWICKCDCGKSKSGFLTRIHKETGNDASIQLRFQFLSLFHNKNVCLLFMDK